MRWVLAPAILSTVALVLLAALARTGNNLNLDAPVIDAEVAAPAAMATRTAQAVPRRARTLLVVIDGLRADMADRLPFLAALARTGSRARLWAEEPTYSTAQYVALLAGVPPRDSGVRTNETIRPAGVDDVARRARAAGRVTAVMSTCVDWWQRLFPVSFNEARVVPTAGVLAAAERLAAHADFVVVHLCEVDEAGHAGGARSPRYQEAAREADQLTAALARMWGGPGANVLVTADHGHRDRGGHGGGEPEVSASFLFAAGPGVVTGADVRTARSVDLAPTLAALLGVAAPAAASGSTLVDVLHLTPAERAATMAADDERRARVAVATARGRQVWGQTEARARLLRSIPALAVVMFLAWLARRHPHALLRGLFALGLAAAAFAIGFGSVSFSAARRGIVWGVAIAALAFIFAALALAVGLLRREGPLGAVAVAAGFAPPALAAFVHSGLFAPRFTCEPAWVAAAPPFAYAALAAACAAAAPVTVWLAIGSRRMRRA